MDPSIIGGARVKVQIDESMMLYRKSHTGIIPNRNFVMVILVFKCFSYAYYIDKFSYFLGWLNIF